MTGGNFDVVLADILKRATPTNPIFAYRDGEQTYFVLHDENGLNFIVVGAHSPKLQDAATFLQRLRRTFLTSPSVREWREASAYGLQNEFSDQIHELIVTSNPPLITAKEEIEPLEKDLLLPMETENMDHRLGGLGSERVWQFVKMYRLIGAAIVVVIVVIVLAVAH
jgi:hypothetical protein